VGQISEGKFFRLCNSEPTSDMGNPYCHERFNKFISNESKKIDYLLFRGKSPEKVDFEIIKSPFVSDHYPMFVKITI